MTRAVPEAVREDRSVSGWVLDVMVEGHRVCVSPRGYPGRTVYDVTVGQDRYVGKASVREAVDLAMDWLRGAGVKITDARVRALAVVADAIDARGAVLS